MLPEKELTRISKFISLVLRHKPGTIALVLDRHGWASTRELIEKMNRHGIAITEAVLHHLVATNPKKRFSFNEDGTKIRAAQGHSLNVDLQLVPALPPQLLYHGTGAPSVEAILATGLQKRGRQHVHLSKVIETALQVGSRYGPPRVFEVAAGRMSAEGYTFYCSDNGVWLVDAVPPSYLKLLEPG